jgi:hypothetical protein
MRDNKSDEQFTEKEAQARFEAALRGALKTPPQTAERRAEETGGWQASPPLSFTSKDKQIAQLHECKRPSPLSQNTGW